jgi:hypothetical protein
MAARNPTDGAVLVELGLLELWSAHREEGFAALRVAATRSAEPAWRSQAKALLEKLA